MDYQPIIKAVERIAPTLAGAIAGPAGSVVVNLIESALGLQNATPDQIVNNINASDTAKQQILALQYQHEEALESLAVKDRDSARVRQAAVVTATGKSDWILNLIALLYTAGFFGYVIFLAISPQQDKGIFHDLLNGYMLVLSFFFGSAYQSVKVK